MRRVKLIIRRSLQIEKKSSAIKNLIKLFKPWIAISSLVFVGHSILLNISKLNDFPINKVTLTWLLYSTIASLLSLFLNAIAWKNIFEWLSLSTKGIPLIKLYLKTNIFKYIPGGIWHFIKRLQELRGKIDNSDALTAVVIEPFLMLSAALLLVPLGGFQSGISILSIIPAIFLHPNFCEPLVKRIKKLKEKQINNKLPNILESVQKSSQNKKTFSYPIQPLIIEILFIIIRFVGFWLCLKAFSMDSFMQWNQWISIFSIAWSAGLIIPGAPGGLGIFESIVLIKSGLLSNSPGMIAVLICYRLSITISDLIAICIITPDRLLKNIYSNNKVQ